MGTDIHGWVEICRTRTTNIDQPNRWIPAMRVDHVVARNYHIFSHFFGARNAARVGVFANRGIPEDIHQHVRQELDRWEQDAHSHTHCTFDEFYPAWHSYVQDQQENDREVSQRWETFVESMSRFAHHYDGKNIRLVVWFEG